MSLAFVVLLYAVMGFLAALIILSTHKVTGKKEIIFLAAAYALSALILYGAGKMGLTPWHMLLVFALLTAIKPFAFKIACPDYTLAQAAVSVLLADISGVMGAVFILVIPAVWDAVTSAYLLMCTFLPPMLLISYLIFKKDFSWAKMRFIFFIYFLFSAAALCVILYLGISRGVFSAMYGVSLDPAVVLPVMAGAFLFFPAARAVLFKAKFVQFTLKDSLILFYSADISGVVISTLVWLFLIVFNK